jgi:hypothetical protein
VSLAIQPGRHGYWLNTRRAAISQAELARIFWVYGEERQSRRIAAALHGDGGGGGREP